MERKIALVICGFVLWYPMAFTEAMVFWLLLFQVGGLHVPWLQRTTVYL